MSSARTFHAAARAPGHSAVPLVVAVLDHADRILFFAKSIFQSTIMALLSHLIHIKSYTRIISQLAFSRSRIATFFYCLLLLLALVYTHSLGPYYDTRNQHPT